MGLKPADVHAWQRDLTAAGKSPHKRKRALEVLRRALRLGVRWEILDRNPAEAVDAPRVSRYQGRAATLPRVARLVREGGRHRHCYAVMAGLGLRVAHAHGVAWPDVDLDAREAVLGWQVRRERATTGAEIEWVRRHAKDREVRLLPLPAMVVDALHDQAVAQMAERQAWQAYGGAWGNAWELVFTQRDGSPVHTSAVDKALAADCARLGLPALTPHDLRRSCASILSALRVPTAVRMRILGHKTARLHQEVYTLAFDDDVREAVAAMDEAWQALRHG